MVATLRRSAWALVAALVSAAAGAARSDPPRVLSVQFVTRGTGLAYSQALGKIAFSRFDPQVLGAPDLLGREDGSGTFQLWIAEADGSEERCLSCADVAGGPRRNQHVGAAVFHPDGQWIVAAVEMPLHLAPHAKCHAGLGAFVDLWASTPDGRRWFQLTRYAHTASAERFPDRPIGALVPRFSRSGRQLVWAEMIGYDAEHPFGLWRLARAEFVVDAGRPKLVNRVATTPGDPGTTFYEAWSFSPDDALVTVASDSGAIHPGYMDVQLWRPRTGSLVNLTRSNDEYEEQALFSPDGRWIAFMSTRDQQPRYAPGRDFWGTFRTDVWLMDATGARARRLTHFNDPEGPERRTGAVTRAIPALWPSDDVLYVELAQNRGATQTHETARIVRVVLGE